jgi:hypothetical protein
MQWLKRKQARAKHASEQARHVNMYAQQPVHSAQQAILLTSRYSSGASQCSHQTSLLKTDNLVKGNPQPHFSSELREGEGSPPHHSSGPINHTQGPHTHTILAGGSPQSCDLQASIQASIHVHHYHLGCSQVTVVGPRRKWRSLFSQVILVCENLLEVTGQPFPQCKVSTWSPPMWNSGKHQMLFWE